ncbi:MAG TPA: hypothetical protein PKD64_18460 [Pirellulaceae bacterium]|nr:hypothetical protein [Pirellulaceae bacterium]HMO94173.1 hypothetical protein [Pirellulaceae bacterium]HMP71288.1 hypothetical protein [Pirellulaceae bacterium]
MQKLNFWYRVFPRPHYNLNSRFLLGFLIVVGHGLLSLENRLLFAQGSSDFVRQINAVEREADKAIDELLKIVNKSERNAKQQWHRVCDEVLKSIDSIEAKAPGHRAVIQKERKDWETIKSVGGEMVKINFDMEMELKLVAREALQTAKDIEAWKKEITKIESNVTKQITKLDDAVGDVTTLAQAAIGVETGIADQVYEIGTLALAAKQSYLKTKKVFQEAFTNAHAKRLEYRQKISGDIRSNRRRLERLIAIKMVPESERAKMTKLEDQLEKVVLDRLQLYQRALDNWVEAASPLNRSFNDFMYEAVGSNFVRALKKLETATLGTYVLTVAAVGTGDLVENFLDSFGNKWRIASAKLRKDSRLRLDEIRGEIRNKFAEESRQLELQRSSRLAKANADSKKLTDSWNRQIAELRNSLTKVRNDSLEHGHIQDRIQDFLEMRETEGDALNRELRQINADCDEILVRYRRIHDEAIKQIEEAAK